MSSTCPWSKADLSNSLHCMHAQPRCLFGDNWWSGVHIVGSLLY
jgi:hypothetical protein